MMGVNRRYELWAEEQTGRGVDLDWVRRELDALEIETPSWGYGDSGTRFKVFHQEGAARDVYEKVAQAGKVHRLTGAAPSVALHIPWDRVDDYGALARHAREHGVRLGAINPNLFQEDAYRLGSLCHPDEGVRRQAVEHIRECIEIAKVTGSSIISLWFADGTNYPGQDDFRARRRRLLEALQQVTASLPEGMRLLIEYKFFEPAFYHTDLADWGTAYLAASRLGPRAQVLVDTGHHAQGTNIEHIVATLLDEGKLGGFHFNDRKYADDDLMVGSIHPFQLFLILKELVAGLREPELEPQVRRVAYMIDQSHNIEPKVPAMVQSVVNVQTAYAKALLVDWGALAQAQREGDVIGAHRLLRDAFETDVRPLLAHWREGKGLPPDPVAASAGV
ncbi:L-rhamnose isomerase [Limnochorda pilosa]